MAIGCVGFLACRDRFDCWRLGWELWEMNKATLATAINEANRFLKLANDISPKEVDDIWPSIKRASIKRASMDLTRALANLRKGVP